MTSTILTIMKTGYADAPYCMGKRAYDKKGAITAANLRFEEDRTRLRIYPCSNHWHLTKQTRGKPYESRRMRGKKGSSTQRW